MFFEEIKAAEARNRALGRELTVVICALTAAAGVMIAALILWVL